MRQYQDDSELAELTKDGLRRGADLVGRMWGWTLEAQRNAPKMTNTDGDPLELQTAVFRVADPGPGRGRAGGVRRR